MRTKPGSAILYLDFDGVLCDSLEECFRASWLTASGWTPGPSVPPEPPFDAVYRARFDACRPFIRSGEDYLVVHLWAADGRVPADQKDFDASLAAQGAARMAELKDRLYTVRNGLLEFHRERWLSWNPLYPGISAALAAQADNPRVWVLSTKKAEFIVQILAHHGVPWPLDRTVYTGQQKKLDWIEKCHPGRAAILVDDQVDHLDFAHPLCQCYLALWGYVSPGAAERSGATLTLVQALELISSFPRDPRPSA